MLSYIGVIHKDDESGYGISFPDLPGCVTVGDNLDELYDMAVEAVSLHLEVLLEDGNNIPSASAIEQILKHEFYKGAVSNMVVRVGRPDKTVKANITLPESDLHIIDRAADKQGKTRSSFMATHAVTYARSVLERTPAVKIAKPRRVSKDSKSVEFIAKSFTRKPQSPTASKPSKA